MHGADLGLRHRRLRGGGVLLRGAFLPSVLLLRRVLDLLDERGPLDFQDLRFSRSSARSKYFVPSIQVDSTIE